MTKTMVCCFRLPFFLLLAYPYDLLLIFQGGGVALPLCLWHNFVRGREYMCLLYGIDYEGRGERGELVAGCVLTILGGGVQVI